MNDLSVAWYCDRELRCLPFQLRRAVRQVALSSWYAWAATRDAFYAVTFPARRPDLWLRIQLMGKWLNAGMNKEAAVERVLHLPLKAVVLELAAGYMPR